MKKTKLMVSRPVPKLLLESGGFPCAICRSAQSVSIGCTRSAVVSEENWLRVQALYVHDSVIRLDRLTKDLSHI